jgi:hypothetical protein
MSTINGKPTSIECEDCAGRPDGTRLPYPGDPTWYMVCVAETRAYPRQCPEGTRYDPEVDDFVPL